MTDPGDVWPTVSWAGAAGEDTRGGVVPAHRQTSERAKASERASERASAETEIATEEGREERGGRGRRKAAMGHDRKEEKMVAKKQGRERKEGE